jgi:hypothetical protein
MCGQFNNSVMYDYNYYDDIIPHNSLTRPLENNRLYSDISCHCEENTVTRNKHSHFIGSSIIIGLLAEKLAGIAGPSTSIE